jgi:hypothetical protein
MSNQPAKPTKPQPKPEKNTDATALLSPEELRAIAGGVATQPPPSTGGGGGGVQPNGAIKGGPVG